jgi:hypothetical protein
VVRDVLAKRPPTKLKKDIKVIYEIRIYEAADGKADAMRQRFKKHVIPRLPRHGIELVGVFGSSEEDGRLIYMTRFKSEDGRAGAWKAFGADAEWKAIKAASEQNGPLLKHQTVSILSSVVGGLLLD